MTENGLYIQMFSLHGLVRGSNLELGRDADTGGQVKYVIELGRALAELDGIRRVDLFTRFLAEKVLSEDYARRIETVTDRFRIVRVQCGGRKYMRKELLWPHLDEFVDETIKFIKREMTLPDIVHGHYPDAGYVAMQLARIFGVPFIYTGHSLGRAKKQKLLAEGLKQEEIVRKYRIDQRIRVEEEILKYADLIVTSTHQEVREQYGMYHNGQLPDFRVLPPGIDIEKFYPYYHDMLPESERSENALYAQAKLLQELNRFFLHPEKPLILALCRPDKRKNIAPMGRPRTFRPWPTWQCLPASAGTSARWRKTSGMFSPRCCWKWTNLTFTAKWRSPKGTISNTRSRNSTASRRVKKGFLSTPP